MKLYRPKAEVNLPGIRQGICQAFASNVVTKHTTKE
jgi:hypothetical protein